MNAKWKLCTDNATNLYKKVKVFKIKKNLIKKQFNFIIKNLQINSIH